MKIMLKNARLAFPNLFSARAGQDGGEAKFGASLILDPKNPAIAELNAAFTKIAKEKWADKGETILKGLKAQDRLCLHDGATKASYQGFEGNMYVSASSKLRPSVFDRTRTPLTAEDGKPYSGCYVNASIELWAQDSKQYGKRINAQLRGVQFVADGDAFAAGQSASEEEFEDLGDQGDDTDPTA
jgi:Protein of unknown function (DUF2815)